MKHLSMLMKTMMKSVGLDPSDYTNKSLRATCVTRMSLGQVPKEIGMMVTCHKREASYDKYDGGKALKTTATQAIVVDLYDKNGGVKNFKDVYGEKVDLYLSNSDPSGAAGFKSFSSFGAILNPGDAGKCDDSGAKNCETGSGEKSGVDSMIPDSIDDEQLVKSIRDEWPDGARALGFKPVTYHTIFSRSSFTNCTNCVFQVFEGNVADNAGGGWSADV